jgi:DNA-directed RNA polymerase specialized sigma24 family protein
MRRSFPVLSAALVAPPSDLAHALKVLSDATQDGILRQSAAAVVIRELDRWGPEVIRKRYARALAVLSRETVIADALQHAAVVAATTRTPFQGADDTAARAWLRRVVLNFVADELRRSAAARSRHAGQECADEVPAPDGDTARPDNQPAAELPERAVEDLARAVEFLRHLRSSMLEAHRACDAESLLRASLVYVAHLSGMPTGEQIRLLGMARTSAGTGEAKRAHDQIYQMRRRGRDAILNALLRMRTREADGGTAA